MMFFRVLFFSGIGEPDHQIKFNILYSPIFQVKLFSPIFHVQNSYISPIFQVQISYISPKC